MKTILAFAVLLAGIGFNAYATDYTPYMYCGDYTVQTTASGQQWVLFQGTEYPAQGGQTQSDQAWQQVYNYTAQVPAGTLLINQTIQWFDHYDRVDWSSETATLFSPDGVRTDIGCN
jgi:hypothetical protein